MSKLGEINQQYLRMFGRKLLTSVTKPLKLSQMDEKERALIHDATDATIGTAVKESAAEKLDSIRSELAPDQSIGGVDATLKGELTIKWGPDGIEKVELAYYMVDSVKIDLEKVSVSFSKEERILRFELMGD